MEWTLEKSMDFLAGLKMTVASGGDLCVIVKGVIFDWCARHGEFSLSEYTNDLLTRCIRGIFTEQN